MLANNTIALTQIHKHARNAYRELAEKANIVGVFVYVSFSLTCFFLYCSETDSLSGKKHTLS